MLANFLPSIFYIYIYIHIHTHTHTHTHCVLPEDGQVGRDTLQIIINSENDKKVESYLADCLDIVRDYKRKESGNARLRPAVTHLLQI